MFPADEVVLAEALEAKIEIPACDEQFATDRD